MKTFLQWAVQHADVANWGLLLVAIVTAVYAASQVEQARRARRDQARPYVIAGMRRVDEGIVELYVKNFGVGAAYDVILQSAPELDSVSNPRHFKPFHCLPTLVPGDEWSTIWETKASERYQNDVTTRFVATVTYRGSSLRRSDRFSDEYILDWEVVKTATHLPRKGLHDLVRAVENLAKPMRAIEAIAEGVGTDKPGQHTLLEAADQLAKSSRRISLPSSGRYRRVNLHSLRDRLFRG